jgi:hypothetical protein
MHETEQHWHHSTVQNKVLRNIVDATLYIRNADLHWDIQKGMVTKEIRKFAKKHEERFLHHVNFEEIQLLDNGELVRRLKKNFWAGVVIIKSRARWSAPQPALVCDKNSAQC